MYYLARTVLKWDDETFWESSPRFLFKQLDLFSQYNKPNKQGKFKKPNNINDDQAIKGEKRRLKVMNSEEVKRWQKKNN